MQSPERDQERVCHVYRFGSVEFDEARRELKVAGLPVEIEPRVMDLLHFLLQHAGELVTKEELLREVWAGRVTIDKVLPNAIAKLRRAIGQDNGDRIVTQARVGYRLDGPVSRVASARGESPESVLAAGEPVPRRPEFRLCTRLGAHRGSEVWRAEHQVTGELRIFKFALDAERLRALKRETTLLRVLHEGGVGTQGFVALRGWSFECAPYYLELDDGGRNLADWGHERLAGLDEQARLALFLQIAHAVERAHALGVLHKDIKPANVLIRESAHGIAIQLTDFGSGRMLDPERLQELGITQPGMTTSEDAATDSQSGTPLYLAPELFAGQSPTVQSDVYALGVLLFQIVAGKLGEPMASAWESSIADPLLRADILLATDRDPARRLASVALLTDRLQRIGERRLEAERQAEAIRERQQLDLALARSKARRPYVWALLALLLTALGVTLFLRDSAEQARLRAESELARASSLLRFLEEDLIGRANPLVMGRGADAPLREVMLAARDRLDHRFSTQALTAAPLHLSLAKVFNTLDLLPEAEAEVSKALQIYTRELGADSLEASQARAIRARVLSRLSRFDAAAAELAELERLSADPRLAFLHAFAAATYHLTRGSYADAIPHLQLAIAAPLDRWHSELQRDNLNIELIFALGLSGEAEGAVREFERFAADLQSRPGDTGLLLAVAQLHAARSVSMAGDHQRAEAMLLAAREVISEQLGPEHTRLLGLLNELMGVYSRQGDYARVIPIAEDLHRRVRAKFGDTHNTTWVSLGNLGRAQYELGQDAAASAALKLAYERMVGIVGADNPQAQDVAFLLAGAELAQGRSAQAWLDTLDAATLEKGMGTGTWAHGLHVLEGLQARLDGDAQRARRLLASGLEGLREKPTNAGTRLYREGEQALRELGG